MYPLYALSLFLFLVLLGMFCWKFLHSILSMTHEGYLHMVKTSLMCCNYVLISSGVVETVLALSVKVLMMLYVAHM